MTVLPATPEALETLHALLEAFWRAIESSRGEAVPAVVRLGLEIAASEIATNIIRYSGAPSFDVALILAGQEIEARFRDSGVPFRGVLRGDPAALAEDGALAEGGRGLALANRALHTLLYRRSRQGVNHWSLIVLLPVSS